MRAALCLLLALASCGPVETPQRAENGLLDLTQHDFALPAPLDGEWRFAWKTFADPAQPLEGDTIQVPGRWNEFVTAQGPAGGRGYATYRLRVRTPRQPLALRVLHFDTSARIFINGKEVYAAGNPGVSEQDTIPDRRPAVVDLEPAGELDIIIHAANFHHRNGGFPRHLILGRPDALHAAQLRKVSIEVFFAGGLVMMALYHFALFALRRTDISPLYFGLFCVLAAVRSDLLGERTIANLLVPERFWLTHRLEYLSFYLSVPVFFAYARSLFSGRLFSGVFLRVWLAVFGAGALSVVLTPFYYSQAVFFFQAAMVAAGVHILCGGIAAALQRQKGARVFLAAFAFLFAAAVNDILYSRMVLNTGFFVASTLFLFVFTQAFLLSRLYAEAFRRVEELAVDLAASEKKYRHLVEDSGEIILSLSRDGAILSANRRAKQILGYSPEELKGRQLSELLYEQTNSNLFLARHIFEQRLASLARGAAQEFPAHFRTRSSDLCELTVRMQLNDASHGVLVNLAQKPMDILARHCLEDRRLYSLENSFSLADMLNHSVTAGLDMRLSEEDQMLLRLGLREILINAIEHGNLGITFEEKSRAVAAGRLHELIQERLKNPAYAARKLHLRVDATQERIEFTIRDEGTGFDHRAARAKSAEHHELHGRGLAFALQSFDRVDFNDAGNEVKLTKFLRR